MTGKFLLDTNIVIALFAGEAEVSHAIARTEEVFLSSVVLGELYYGARKSSRSTENLACTDTFASSNTVLGFSIPISRQYGAIKESLRAKGKMIPENDIWIAAVAIHYELTLATRDAHFIEIHGLLVAPW